MTSKEAVRLSRGHDEWGPLYTGTYRDHTLTFQHSDTAGQWHVWIKEPNGNEQHGDGYETRSAALDAAVTGIDHALKVADSYAAKWVAEHDSAEPPVYEEPTDSALAACFANCAIKAKPAWYPAIRAAIAAIELSRFLTRLSDAIADLGVSPSQFFVDRVEVHSDDGPLGVLVWSDSEDRFTWVASGKEQS